MECSAEESGSESCQESSHKEKAGWQKPKLQTLEALLSEGEVSLDPNGYI